MTHPLLTRALAEAAEANVPAYVTDAMHAFWAAGWRPKYSADTADWWCRWQWPKRCRNRYDIVLYEHNGDYQIWLYSHDFGIQHAESLQAANLPKLLEAFAYEINNPNAPKPARLGKGHRQVRQKRKLHQTKPLR
jgi:hypothetical protein